MGNRASGESRPRVWGLQNGKTGTAELAEGPQLSGRKNGMNSKTQETLGRSGSMGRKVVGFVMNARKWHEAHAKEETGESREPEGEWRMHGKCHGVLQKTGRHRVGNPRKLRSQDGKRLPDRGQTWARGSLGVQREEVEPVEQNESKVEQLE